jgi:hypothetical protein
VQTLTGNRAKGTGYYGRSDGIHTVQFRITGFKGVITIQGTLVDEPTDGDWFDITLENPGEFSIDTTGLIAKSADVENIEYTTTTTESRTYNFTANVLWVRAKITEWTHGTVDFVNLRT